MRDTSRAFKEAMFAQGTGEVALLFLEINHAELNSPFRFVLNTEPQNLRRYEATLGAPYGAGAFAFIVSDTSRFVVGELAAVELDDGTFHESTVVNVVDPTVIITDGLPSGAASGNSVYATQVFNPLGFEFVPPGTAANSNRGGVLRLDNVDRSILHGLREAQATGEAPEVDWWLALASQTHRHEIKSHFSHAWRLASWNLSEVAGELEGPAFLLDAYPKDIHSPTTAPAIFRFATDQDQSSLP